MPVKDRFKQAMKAPTTVEPALQKSQHKAQQEVQAVQVMVGKLDLAFDPDDLETCQKNYAMADELRATIKAKRSWWKELIYGTDANPGPIKLAYKTYDSLLGVNRTIDKPLEKAEDAVTLAMKNYKVSEARWIREQEEAKDRERQRLLAEAQKKELQAAQAQTNQMRGKLEKRRLELEAQAEQVQEQETPVITVAANSGTRTRLAWRMRGESQSQGSYAAWTEFLTGILAGKIPMEAVQLNDKFINEYLKAAPERVMEWSGIEVYEDIIIASSR